jgi:hypothetical protein
MRDDQQFNCVLHLFLFGIDQMSHGSLEIPETDVTIDYTVDQSNTDKWNGIIGANWDITRRWSLMVEYNGFFGSRESIFAAVGWRF